MRRIRKIRKYDRRTRKKTSRRISDYDNFAIYDRDDVIDYLQTGSIPFPVSSNGCREETRTLMTQVTDLGWDPEFVEIAFRSLDDSLLLEYPLRLFIVDYFKALIRRLTCHQSIVQSLLRIGLRSDVADALGLLLEPLQDSRYTDNQILDTAIYYLLQWYEPVTDNHATHLLRSDVVDTWITYTHSSKEVTIFNISQTCSSKAISAIEEALTYIPAPPDHTYFFHTTSWKGSLNIMEYVDRDHGRRGLDFGIYPGFYMAETALDCLDWGAKKNRLWGNETAIMIFSVPKILPAQLSYKELRGHEWSSVITQSRLCKEIREFPSIRSIDLIYGVIARNPTAVEQGGTEPLPHTPPIKQFVSKSDAGDAFLHTCLLGCIYFRKDIPLS